jgi:hypothetical protein
MSNGQDENTSLYDYKGYAIVIPVGFFPEGGRFYVKRSFNQY